MRTAARWRRASPGASGLAERVDQLVEAGLVAELAGEGVEQAGSGSEQDVHRRTGDATTASDFVDLQRPDRPTLEGHAGRLEDPLAGCLGGGRSRSLHVSTFVHG